MTNSIKEQTRKQVSIKSENIAYYLEELPNGKFLYYARVEKKKYIGKKRFVSTLTKNIIENWELEGYVKELYKLITKN